MQPGGQPVLETLIVPADVADVLSPSGRYAKMRNVWMIPSLKTLETWMQRTGFESIRVVDSGPTTELEQRSTEWMTFESLPDFLDPADSNKTIEGYPSPQRAVVIARRKS